MTIQKIIQKVKQNEKCSLAEIEWLKNASSSFEFIALYYHIVLSKAEYDQVTCVLKNKIDEKYWVENVLTSNIDEKYQNLIKKVYLSEHITKNEFDFLSSAIVKNTINYNLLAILLVNIYYFNLDYETTEALTQSMLYSGNIYDYRSLDKLDKFKIVRRYPTGALSEKIALILPAILSHYSKKYRICSPFLVAKSLGFTGGTWDKLRSIPDIKFIKQGNALVNTLKSIGAAYCMTGDNVAPADRFLYEFRSLTGTIESDSLIVASIASKQLAIPADILVMDVRYGEGAFLQNYTEAVKTGEGLKKVLHSNGMHCILSYTDTLKPNGVCIGNYWEVYEAICLLKGIYKNEILKYDISKLQIELVVKMFMLIIEESEEDIDLSMLEQELVDKFKKGMFYTDFINVLKSNKVEEKTIDAILSMKDSEESIKSFVRSPKSGILSKIKQKEIGNYVNFYLDNNNYEFDNYHFNYSGMILNTCVGEKIRTGDILCTVIHSGEKVIDHNYINSLFVVD